MTADNRTGARPGPTVWADVSEHNGQPVNDRYPGRWLAFRACDGTYRDPLYPANERWTRTASQLVGYIVYLVWPRSIGISTWTETMNTLTSMLGTGNRRRLVVMMDVETWNRPDLARDWSSGLEAMRAALVKWLNAARPGWQRSGPLAAYYRGRDERRVIGYGNRGDLLTMAKGVKWPGVVLADYSADPTPAKVGPWPVLARQYTDAGVIAPWGKADLNRATVGPRRLARRLGLGVLTWRLR